jgi:hypothetical protein
MSEREIVTAIRKYINKQNSSWSFIRGREVLTKQQVLRRLNVDKNFRKFMVQIVVAQTVEILGGKST